MVGQLDAVVDVDVTELKDAGDVLQRLLWYPFRGRGLIRTGCRPPADNCVEGETSLTVTVSAVGPHQICFHESGHPPTQWKLCTPERLSWNLSLSGTAVLLPKIAAGLTSFVPIIELGFVGTVRRESVRTHHLQPRTAPGSLETKQGQELSPVVPYPWAVTP